MDMGTGKTRVAIELAARRWDRLSKVVVCCPVSLKETWRRELHKHVASPRVYVFDDGTCSETLPNADWYVVGLESISQSDRQTLALDALVDEDAMMIIDESGYIKNHRAVRTRRLTVIGKRARYRLILTGTPISQGIEDLFAQMKFLSPRILGYRSFYAFANNHLEYHPDYPGPRRAHAQQAVPRRQDAAVRLPGDQRRSARPPEENLRDAVFFTHRGAVGTL
jgi:SNF2 family DNA or RNA helicase